MIRVNLLPPELLAERQRRLRLARAVLAGALAVALLAILYAFLFVATSHARSRVVALQQERARVETEIAKYAPYVGLEKEVTARLARLKKAMGTPPEWLQLLTTLANVIPGDVWLTDCVATFTPARGVPAQAQAAQGQAPEAGAPPGRPQQQPPQAPLGQLVIRGLTYDQTSTANWLAQLYKVPELTDVRCVFSGVENYRGVELIRFEIKASVRPGTEYDPSEGGIR